MPPVTWLRPVTVRSLYELGVLEAARGDTATAAARFRGLLSMLEDPGPAASDRAERARARLAELPPR